jgi:tryptophan 2,3-dioxygenase
MALAQFQHAPRERWLDSMLIELRGKLGGCSAGALNNVVAALPALSSGVRLSEVVAEAQAHLDAMMAAGAVAYADVVDDSGSVSDGAGDEPLGVVVEDGGADDGALESQLAAV